MRFDDQVVFLSGAAHGIGAATARRLHREGAAVVVADDDLAAAEALVAELGARASAVHCDVIERESVDAAFAVAEERYGRLDQLVTVVGGSRAMPMFHQQSDELWSDLIELNLTGTMRCLRAALPLLQRSQRPAAVLVSSVNGLTAFGEEAYGAAKAGLSNLVRNLAVRYGPDGIRVNVVAPGTVRTRNWDHQPGQLDRLARFCPLGRVGEPEDVAAAIAFLASTDASWITGITMPVDGGALAGPLQLSREP